MAANPVLVEVVRGPMVESRHRGAVAVVEASGRVIAAAGDIDTPVYPRSAVKPLQALPLIASGAADAFSLTDEHIALAAGSHAGTARHVDLVAAWLETLGLTEADLACGALAPVDEAAKAALRRAGLAPRPIHHNCSGKHAGFLTVARHLGVPTQGYENADHPVQVEVLKALETMTGWRAGRVCGCDGCGVPTWGVPVRHLALAMARLADPSDLSDDLKGAATRVSAAMRAHPDLVAGPGQFDTDFARAHPDVVVKSGAEGMLCGFLPEHGPERAIGFAIKIDDGALRAAWVTAAAVVQALGVSVAERWLTPEVRNNAGVVVGRLQAVPRLSLPD